MVTDYEAVTKEFLALLNEHQITAPSFHFTTIAAENLVYAYITPIEGYAAMDKMSEDWAEVERRMGKKWQDLMRRGSAAIEYAKQWIVEELPALFYVPENRTLKAAGTNFRHYDFYYLHVGKEQEAEQIAQEWKTLYKRKNVPQYYTVYCANMGTELPLYIVGWSAKDATDFRTQRGKSVQLLGEEGKALWERILALVRRFEHKNGYLRPDLSYLPTI